MVNPTALLQMLSLRDGQGCITSELCRAEWATPPRSRSGLEPNRYQITAIEHIEARDLEGVQTGEVGLCYACSCLHNLLSSVARATTINCFDEANLRFVLTVPTKQHCHSESF